MNRNKLHHRSLALLGSTLMSFGLLSTISPTQFGNPLSGAHGLSRWQELFQGERAEARKSGGRVRGGSFGKKSSPPKSSSSPSSSSSGKSSTSKPGKSTTTTTTTTTRSSSSYGGGGYYGGGGWYYRSGGYYYVGGHPMSGGALAFWLTLFILFPFLGVFWWWRGWNSSPYDDVYHDETTTTTTTTTTHYDDEDDDEYYGTGNPELDNDIVNVSRLQLVMLSEARGIQADLNTLGQQIDTETEEGTLELLRESVLALMRHPEYWAYAQGTSQRLKTREMAQRMFERLSLEERSRFSSETLVKVGSGNLRQSDASEEGDSADAGYIVVTLLVGTEDDDPLFGELRSAQDVKNALTTLAAVTPDYLLTVELLWTPQSDGRSLSEDELLMEYPQLTSLR